MNIVKELRRKKGIQQKELAIEIGVSRPTVSEWESGKKDPSGERLKKLAEFFNVDELVILGKGTVNLYPSDNPGGLSETEQIVQHVLHQLGTQPKTIEARIISGGVDKMPPEQREQAVNIMKAVFTQYAEYFNRKEDDK